MNELVKKQIEIIMQGKVYSLVKLPENQLDFVLALIYAARYKPVEVKPIEKRKVKK